MFASKFEMISMIILVIGVIITVLSLWLGEQMHVMLCGMVALIGLLLYVLARYIQE